MSTITTVIPEETDTELAVFALRRLNAALDAEQPVHLHLGDHLEEVEVPRSALTMLTYVLDSFAQGEEVSVLRSEAEMTTQQAADILNVSRPFLIGLLDSGQISYRTVGTHRRVKSASLLRYMREDDARRQAAADALSAETHKLGFV